MAIGDKYKIQMLLFEQFSGKSKNNSVRLHPETLKNVHHFLKDKELAPNFTHNKKEFNKNQLNTSLSWVYVKSKTICHAYLACKIFYLGVLFSE